MRTDALANLLHSAIVHFNAGELVQAETLCRTVLKRQRDNPDGWHLLGMIALRHGNADEAVSCIKKCSVREPGNAAALCNLGVAYKALGRLSEAAAAFEKAAAAAPKDDKILYNLANTRMAMGEFEAAIAAYRQALSMEPGNPDYFNNLGRALEKNCEVEAAVGAYSSALALRPLFAGALTNLGNAYVDLGRPAEALQCHRRAVAVDPAFDAAQSNLIFALNFDPAAGPDDHRRERLRFGEMHPVPPPSVGAAAAVRFEPDRRLRVGYVSAHFRHQAATYAFAPVIINHDRRMFDVYCYSDTVAEDELTSKLRRHVKTWRATAALSNGALIERIRADKIDILVDLVGHMAGNRLAVFGQKPAPVQVTGWGEPTGTGLPAMDYLLADPVLVSPHMRTLLREEVIDLPCFLCFWTPELLPEPGPLPALSAGHVTFGSFNRPAKLSDPVLRLWARILRALPSSRLVLKSSSLNDGAHRARIHAILGNEGISGDRLTILGDSPRAEHMEAYRLIDVALDPFPHSGGMTTLDAMAMGVPVIACPGPTISSRLASACITTLGLTDWVAADHDEYVAMAIRKAADLDNLQRLRQSLRTMLNQSPLGDDKSYALAVENAYRAMWRRRCRLAQGLGHASVQVPPDAGAA